jgi:esterase/lipase superfamily enzyme
MGRRHSLKAVGVVLSGLLLAIAPGREASAQTRVHPTPGHGKIDVQRLPRSNAAAPADLDTLNRQITQLSAAGKKAQAIVLAKQAVKLTERRYGSNHAATAAALTRLAQLLVAEKRYAEAEPLLKRALAIREKGGNSTDIAAALNNLAAVYQKQGRAAEAKALSQRAAAVRTKPPGRSFSKKAQEAPSGTRHAHQYVRPKEDAAPAAPPPLAARGRSTEAQRREPSGGSAPMPRTTMSRAPASAPPAPMAAKKADDKEKDKKWDVVPVYYGTDRAEEPNAKRLAFGSDRGHQLELGRALVTVPRSHQVPDIERPWVIKIPYFDVTIYEEAEDREKHFTMEEIKRLSHDDFLKLVRQRLAASARYKDQALVFVHGFNTSFDNAVYRTAQIAYVLKFDGAPFLYSWPSGGAVGSYTYDRESAEGSTPYLRQFLEMVVKETGAKQVSIIAHSMGNQPLLDVLKDMKASTPKGVVISQVILAAPDVDADNFANLAKSIKGFARGVTLYAASNDRALIASRNFWGHTRAGDVPAGGPLVIPGVDTVDVTAISTDTFALNHSGYAQNNKLLTDIGELLRTGLRPPDERELKPERVSTKKGPYWRYATPATGSVGSGAP